MLSRATAADDTDAADTGAITVLVLGYVALALALVAVGVDASKVFLAQRALSAAADNAALAGAGGIDKATLYDGPGPVCGMPLPLDLPDASARAAASLADDQPDLAASMASVAGPDTTVSAGAVTVSLHAQVALPFHQVLGWLDPSRPDGLVGITETSQARSPVADGGCPAAGP